MKYKSLSKTLGFLVGIISLLNGHDLDAKTKSMTADIVIIGGGTAGCVLANKLSTKYKVILLEGGKDQTNNPLIFDPKDYTEKIKEVNEFLWEIGHWVTPNQITQAPRFFAAVAGKLLGGGSCINELQYIRSTASYFSELQAITGDSAWGPANAFKVYNDIENFHGISGLFNPAVHGFKGPLNIRQCALNTPAATSFANSLVTAAATSGISINVINDYNDPSTPNGAFVNWQLTENPDETRAQSFQAYLRSQVKQQSSNVYTGKNLVMYINTKVEQILFSNDRTPVAKGVKALVDGDEFIFQAKKKVIVSAGFQSPVILQLSGIGPKAMLDGAGIDVLVDNPNVGKVMFNPTLLTLFATGALPADPNANPNNLYIGGGFTPDPTRPSDTDRGFQFYGYIDPDFPQFFDIAAMLINAKSKGAIGVISSDPLRMPIFQFNYMTDPADLTSAIAAYGVAYNTLVNMGLTPDPSLPLPSNPGLVQTWVQANFTAGYYWVGACAMGTSPQNGVVDSSGNVFGVKNLVVADITISPVICRGKTQGIAYLIGNIIASKILKK